MGDKLFSHLSAFVGASMGTNVVPFDLECALVNAAGYLSNHENIPTFLRSGATLTGKQMVAHHTPQHTVHSLRESPITLCYFPDILLYALAGYLGIDIITIGSPYRHPSHFACRAQPPPILTMGSETALMGISGYHSGPTSPAGRGRPTTHAGGGPRSPRHSGTSESRWDVCH